MQKSCCLLLLAASVHAQSVLERPLPYPIPEHPYFSRAVEKGTRTRDGHPGSSAWTNHTDYVIKAALDPTTARVTGHVDMTYTNNSPKALRDVRIHLRQNLYRKGVIRNVRVAITGGMQVEKATINGKPARSGRRGFQTSGTVMRLRLPERLEPGDSVKVGMDFAFTVPPAGPGRSPRMGHESNHVFYLGYWYPQMAVYEDVRGWVAQPYMGGGEFFMGYGNYDVSITAPHGWIVNATGALQNPKKVLPTKVRKRLRKARTSREIVHVVGAGERAPGKSTAYSSKGRLTWRFKARNVRDVAVSISDRYVWDATHAVTRTVDGKPEISMIHAVYEPDGRTGKAWKRTAEYARHTIEWMSKNIYPYPWPHMTACEGIVGGGMEYPMMTCVGVGGFAGALQSVTAHELIHMWFPMIVGSDEKSWAWMDEGVTDFFTSLVDADFRNSKNPIRQVYAEYRGFARSSNQVPCMIHADSLNESNRMPFYSVTYGKTKAVLHQLMGMLGEESFMKAMRAYTRDWAWKHPHPRDLFNTFNRETGQDLDWYFREWFYETWTLDQQVAGVKTDDNGTEVTVEDAGDALGPAVVEVEYANGKTETRTIPASHWLAGTRSAKLKFGPEVRRVTIDPHRTSLDVNRKNNVWTLRKAL